MSREIERSAALYYHELARTTPINDSDEERRLVYRWKRYKDAAARDALLRAHLRFVVKVARKFSRDPDILPDLIAAGNIGYIKALDKFDLTQKTRFLTYASWWIQEEIFKELYSSNSLVHVPVHRQKAQRKKAKAFQKALAEHGPEASEVRRMDPGTPEGMTVNLDVLRDCAEDNPMRTPGAFETQATSARLRKAISSLPPREQTVLNLYYGIKDDRRNLVQIAAILSMSPERVRQIKLSGEKQLRTTLERSHSILSSRDAY